MKNIILLLAVALTFAFSAVSFADKGPVGRSNTLDALGASQGPLEQWFINVKNVSGGALLNGDLVVWDVTEDDGYSVTTSASAGAQPACILAVACADDAMCKCQTYGIKEDVNFDANSTDSVAGGLAYISENTAAYVGSKSTTTTTDIPVGFFYDASSTSGDVQLFIKLR